MRGIVQPMDVERAYLIASDALMLLAEVADDFHDLEAKFLVRGIAYEALGKILKEDREETYRVIKAKREGLSEPTEYEKRVLERRELNKTAAEADGYGEPDWNIS